MPLDIHTSLHKLRVGDPLAQRKLYETYKGVLFGISKRYIADFHEAEDVFVSAFTKIFKSISQYSGEGNFEGWMKKIVVNEALMHLRAKKMHFRELEPQVIPIDIEAELDSSMDIVYILEAINSLPDGYRTVFNLYEVEGYKHKEIAEELDISINTSKSQLILAKKRLREILKKKLTNFETKLAK